MTAPPPTDDTGPAPATPPVQEAAAQDLRASASSVGGRAALALLLLVGYFVLVVVVVGGLALLTFQAFATGSAGVLSTKLAVFTGIVALAIGRAVFAVERRGDDDQGENGIPVGRVDQPELWALVDDVSQELGVPAPDDLRLVDDVNAFVHQDTRLLGLLGGRRHMGIGVALLQVLTVDQLRGVVAHELGHYAGGDTRLSALVYRASVTIQRTVLHLGATSLIGRLFALYARLYQRVSLAVRRHQELRADEGSVRVVGQAVHESALREAQAAAAAWAFFGDSYVVPVWQSDSAPQDMYAGYRALLADPVRQREVDEVRRADDEPTSPYDSHPSLAERVAHVRRLPERPAPGDSRPARSLLRGAEEVERRVTDLVNHRVLGRVPSQRFSFTGALDATPYTADLAHAWMAVARATAATDGGPQPADLDRTLQVLEAGRDVELVTELTGDRRSVDQEGRAIDLRNIVTGPLATAASCALVDAGVASWRASWSRPVQLVDRGGEELDLSAVLDQALQTDGVAGLRAALQACRVPLDAAPDLPASDAPGSVEGVLAVWPELSRGRSWFDAVVTRDLLVLVPQPKSWTVGLRRGLAAQYGIGRGRLRQAAASRVEDVLRAPLEEVCRRPGVRTVRWDDVPAVQFRGGLATAWVLRLPGLDKPLDKLKAQDDGIVPEPAQTSALLRQLVGDRLDSSA